jgi:hypothetical protein
VNAAAPPGRALSALLAAALLFVTLALLAAPALAGEAGPASPQVGARGGERNWDARATYWDLRGRIPWTDESYDFTYNVGMAHYGKPYIYRMQGDGIYAVPYRLPLPPENGKPPQRNGTILKVLGREDFSHVLGVADVGSPSPDAWVFYVKSSGGNTIFWRQASEQYRVEHQFAWPYERWQDHFRFEADNQGRFLGEVGTHAGRFYIAWLNPFLGKTYSVYAVINLDLARSSGPDVSNAKQQVLAVADGSDQIRSFDVASIWHEGKEWLAVASVCGTPDPSFTRFKAYGKWKTTTMQLGFFRWNGISWEEDIPHRRNFSIAVEDNWYRAQVDDGVLYGTRGVRLVQGGVPATWSAGGDLLQVFTQNAGAVDGRFCAQFVARYEYSLDRHTLTQGADIMYDTAKREPDVDSVDMMAWTAADPNAKFKNGDYVGNDQYMYVVSTQARASGDNYGGWVSCFKSDTLIPIPEEQFEGRTIRYPVELEQLIDPREWVLEGVVYGPPPFSLQGWNYSDFRGGALKGSETAFKKSNSQQTKLTKKIGGSVTSSVGMEAFGFGFSSSVSFGLDYENSEMKATTSEVGFKFRHEDSDNADYGYFICSRPHYEAQLYSRRDMFGHDIPGSRVYAARCIDKTGDLSLVSYPFNMVNPDADAVSKGMRKHARSADFSNPLWSRDPLDGAEKKWEKISRVSLAGDVRGGWQTDSITKSAETGSTIEGHASLGGKIKAPGGSVKAEIHGGIASESSTSHADNTEVSLGLDQPKEGATGTLAKRLEIDALWLQANQSDVYWVPEAFRSGQNDQRPWCIDYRVTSWTPYSRTGAVAGAVDDCDVAVQVDPADGGDAGITGSTVELPFSAAVPVGGSAAITADEADGYRFVRWETSGDQVSIADADAAQTSVSVSDGGGAGVTAVFKRVLPAGLEVVRRSGQRCDIRMTDADLPALFTVGIDPASLDLGLTFSDAEFSLPADAWTQDGNESVNVSRPWGADSMMDVRIDATGGTWDLRVTGMRNASDFLFQVAGGNVPLSLTHRSETLGEETVPVTAKARMAHATLHVGRQTKTRIDLRGARVVVETPRKASQTRFTISRIGYDPRLFNQRRMLIDLNGEQFYVGPFRLRSGQYVWRGRALQQYVVECRIGDRMSLELSGRFLKPHLNEFLGRNITLRVVNRTRAGEGSMIPAVRTLTDVRLVR